MGRQKGAILIEGTLGNATFFKSRDGYMVMAKGGVSGDRIAKDPKFQRTRENNMEFGNASTSGALLRATLMQVIEKSKDGRMVSRLQKAMTEVLKTDLAGARGQRIVANGDAKLLLGFEFNDACALGAVFFVTYQASFIRASGIMEVSFDAFLPSSLVLAPKAATHFNLSLGVAAPNFAVFDGYGKFVVSEYIPCSNEMVPSFSLTITLPALLAHPVFAVLAIKFVQQVNGVNYVLSNGQFNAASIIFVDTEQIPK